MALRIVASLTETGAYDPRDQLARFACWYRDKYLSSTDRCFDIGNQTRTALEGSEATGEPHRGLVGGMSAGNGSLVYPVPVMMTSCDDLEAAGRFSVDGSRTTRPTVECIKACGVYGGLTAATIERALHTELYVLAAGLAEQVINPRLATTLRGPYRVKERGEISPSGRVPRGLGATLWILVNTDDFLERALLAVNLGNDANIVGAIYGQLVEALYGRSGVPENWRDRLHDTGVIEDLAAGIADRVETSEVMVG